MLGKRAKALFLFLAVSFVLNETGKTEATEEFRCWFDDEAYKMKVQNQPGPVWSDWRTKIGTAVLDFTTIDDWTKFKNAINQAFSDVMGNNPLNNVDHFIRFIQAYKNQKDGKKVFFSLEHFFNTYTARYQPLQDPVSLLIEITHQLEASYSRAKDHLYLVSAYVDPPERFVKHVENSEANLTEANNLEKELRQVLFQQHVAGVIKININNTRGYVLLDPGYINGDTIIYPYSVVLMENKTELSGAGIYGVDKEDINYKLGPKFALTSSRHREKVLYLKYKPFCSFMDSTTKKQLLAPNHGIMTFESDGSPKRYLTFKIVPESVLKKRPSFWLGCFNADFECGEYSLSLESVKTKYARIILEHKNGVKFSNISSYLELKDGDNLLAQIATIQSEVFEDPGLVKEIYDLTNKLNPKLGIPMLDPAILQSRGIPHDFLIPQGFAGFAGLKGIPRDLRD